MSWNRKSVIEIDYERERERSEKYDNPARNSALLPRLELKRIGLFYNALTHSSIVFKVGI